MASCAIACNLPHGLTIRHADKQLTLAGANHPRAIHTGVSRSARWGITPDVDEDWFDDWVKTHAPLPVTHGHVVKNSAARITDQVQDIGAVPTGTDPIDPDSSGFAAENRVETRADGD